MKENKISVRITRAWANLGGVPPSFQLPVQEHKKNSHRVKLKREPLDENNASSTTTSGVHRKRKAVLKDVTNISCKSNYVGCFGASKVQVQEVAKTELDEGLSTTKMAETQSISPMMKSGGIETAQRNTYHSIVECSDVVPLVPSGSKVQEIKDEAIDFEELRVSNHLGILNADSSSEDPQACTLYAHDIYDTTRVTELDQRPSSNYMEELQKDINPIMRGTLIDWLVEVSEEYKLVSDTLFLTVNLIDRFLSQSYIERHRLQLLGVTCTLIASKYEELCAPCAEDLCFITDNTYTRGEVLKMECEVLNMLKFQLSVPTTKTFLRRFVQVAEASCKDPCIEFKYLASYLAELALVEYSFLKFLPSAIAASAVFLARWILNQPNHPWNPTLEHYTNYSASELKTPVIALQDLYLNAGGCPLDAVLHKYSQQKLACVATLTSSRSVLWVYER